MIAFDELPTFSRGKVIGLDRYVVVAHPAQHQLEALTMAADQILSKQEKQTVTYRRNPERGRCSLASRVLLKCIIAEILGCEARQVCLHKMESGKLWCQNEFNKQRIDLDLSTATTEQSTAVAVAVGFGCKVGIDIQRMNPKQRQAYATIFGAHTDETLSEATIWARMEAYGKMKGSGLGQGLRKLNELAKTPDSADEPYQFIDFHKNNSEALALSISGDAHIQIFRGKAQQFSLCS
ncbi:4'-phosphopantetheinyl transferase family protein [Pseudovibrio ascidiaceicola]|uniref:4'-phosphopantetheinyl transferase family protein n=1 Tax=Pseudovibrio ascidiaceicola TaxID=285279 RepID=UPI000D69366E|nr:hypothetical protein [Pseudovibrio ascidiaceicola]